MSITQNFEQPLRIVWNWFGSGHGKGPSDGESGVIKSFVTRHIKAKEDVVVENARQFFNLCNRQLSIVSGDSDDTFTLCPKNKSRRSTITNCPALPYQAVAKFIP